MLRLGVSPAAAAVFAAATVSKALEPLAVGSSSHRASGLTYSVGWAIIVIEMTKLAVCAVALLVQLRSTTGERDRNELIKLDTVQLARLAIPGLLLALTNWLMFAALSTLDPLLYQVVIKPSSLQLPPACLASCCASRCGGGSGQPWLDWSQAA